MKTGTVELKSGKWHWYIIELHDIPSWKVKIRKLNLVDAANEKNEMSIGLPIEGEVQEDLIPELSRFPDERRVIGADGTVWMITPIDPPSIMMAVPPGYEPPPHRIYAQARDRRASTCDLPKGRFLGDFSNADLLRFIGA